MGYREYSHPSAAIACLWVRTGGGTTRVVPDACVDLMWSRGRGAFVAGPDTGPVLFEADPGSVIVGARFAPGAGHALGLPMSELRDLRVEVVELDGAIAERLRGDLDVRTAFARLTEAAVRLAAQSPPDGAVSAAARTLADPRTRVEKLAGDLGFSERQLRRRFDTAVGYGPKTLQRTLRFQRALQLLDADEDLARVAAEAGYADQAHFSRDVRRLAGASPSALRRERFGGLPRSAQITHQH
jgi:AraC-like DNA-binding protein